MRYLLFGRKVCGLGLSPGLDRRGSLLDIGGYLCGLVWFVGKYVLGLFLGVVRRGLLVGSNRDRVFHQRTVAGAMVGQVVEQGSQIQLDSGGYFSTYLYSYLSVTSAAWEFCTVGWWARTKSFSYFNSVSVIFQFYSLGFLSTISFSLAYSWLNWIQ